MKTQNLSCEAKVEIISKKNAILLVDKKDVTDESIEFKYNDNVATLVAKNTANAKMGDIVKLNIQKKSLDLFIKIMYFAPLVFLLAGFLFALKFSSVVYQLVFAASLFLVGTLISLIVIGILGAINKPKFEVVEVIKSAQIEKTENVEMATEELKDESETVAVEENMEVNND